MRVVVQREHSALRCECARQRGAYTRAGSGDEYQLAVQIVDFRHARMLLRHERALHRKRSVRTQEFDHEPERALAGPRGYVALHGQRRGRIDDGRPIRERLVFGIDELPRR